MVTVVNDAGADASVLHVFDAAGRSRAGGERRARGPPALACTGTGPAAAREATCGRETDVERGARCTRYTIFVNDEARREALMIGDFGIHLILPHEVETVPSFVRYQRSGFGISDGARCGPERQERPPADHPPAFWEEVQGGMVREQDARCVSAPPSPWYPFRPGASLTSRFPRHHLASHPSSTHQAAVR